MHDREYEELLNRRIRPALEELKRRFAEEKLLVPKAFDGYFPRHSQGDDLIVYHADRSREWVRFHFPRQDHGKHLCLSDFFASVDEGRFDVLPVQIFTGFRWSRPRRSPRWCTSASVPSWALPARTRRRLRSC